MIFSFFFTAYPVEEETSVVDTSDLVVIEVIGVSPVGYIVEVV